MLMFLQYAPAGALVPLFSLRLQELGFRPAQIGWACATQALAILVGVIWNSKRRGSSMMAHGSGTGPGSTPASPPAESVPV